MKKLTTIIWCLPLLILSCKQTNTTETKDTKEAPDLSAAFDAFYEQFHTDTTYQLSHIVFPLAKQEDGSPWTAEEWEFHNNPLTGDIAIKRDVQTIGRLVNELVYNDMGFFVIHRRFVQINDEEWNLIYYEMVQNMSDWDKVYENSSIDIKPLTKE